MPQLITFDGRPVAEMHRIGKNTIKLIFPNKVPGQTRPTATITQAQWDELGTKTWVAEKPDLRAMATD